MQWLLEDFLNQQKIRNLAPLHVRRSKAKVYAVVYLKWYSESLRHCHKARFLAYCYLQRGNLNKNMLSENITLPQSSIGFKENPTDIDHSVQLPHRPLI